MEYFRASKLTKEQYIFLLTEGTVVPTREEYALTRHSPNYTYTYIRAGNIITYIETVMDPLMDFRRFFNGSWNVAFITPKIKNYPKEEET